MAKPIILTVDDDPQVLAAVRRDIRSRYAADYQILAEPGGEEALATVDEIANAGRVIALFLVDQRMPGMTGTEFLAEARKRFPQAKKLLLTAYADTEAAIEAINDVDLDHYLLKPWSPPEDRLYPIVDDVLTDWQANADIPFEGVTVFGATWSPTTYDVKAFLARNEVPYRFIDIDRDAEAAVRANDLAPGAGDLPVVVLDDGTVMVSPAIHDLATAVGIHTSPQAPFYDLVIVGGGPAGLAAAVYGASEGLSTALIERHAPGGQAGTSSRIENYLGFPSGVSGADLARRAIAQATRLGAELVTAVEVVGVEVSGPLKTVQLSDDSQLTCRALIVAPGMTVKRLNVPDYERFEGAGVYYGAAATEAVTYRDRDIVVVGGANSAGQAAVMFAKTSSKVTMVVRAENLAEKMSQYLIDQITAIDNIEVVAGAKVEAVLGDTSVEGVRLVDRTTNEATTLDAAAVFIFVGAIPHSSFLDGAVAMNDRGFIYTGTDVEAFTDEWALDRDPYALETSVPGVFAAGDVREGAIRRVASAVGEGSIAVTFVHRYLDTV